MKESAISLKLLQYVVLDVGISICILTPREWLYLLLQVLCKNLKSLYPFWTPQLNNNLNYLTLKTPLLQMCCKVRTYKTLFSVAIFVNGTILQYLQGHYFLHATGSTAYARCVKLFVIDDMAFHVVWGLKVKKKKKAER